MSIFLINFMISNNTVVMDSLVSELNKVYLRTVVSSCMAHNNIKLKSSVLASFKTMR